MVLPRAEEGRDGVASGSQKVRFPDGAVVEIRYTRLLQVGDTFRGHEREWRVTHVDVDASGSWEVSVEKAVGWRRARSLPGPWIRRWGEVARRTRPAAVRLTRRALRTRRRHRVRVFLSAALLPLGIAVASIAIGFAVAAVL